MYFMYVLTNNIQKIKKNKNIIHSDNGVLFQLSFVTNIIKMT